MNFPSIFGSANITPAWTYAAHGIVWRLQFTPGGRIVGESRDQEKKAASFFCLDAVSGRVLWQDLTLDEAWWVGIEGVLDDTLVLHGFASPDMPEHRGIRAYDVETGALRWQNDKATYWFGIGQRLFAYRDMFEKRVGYEFDLRTGELKTTYDQSLQELHEIRSGAVTGEFVPDVVLPEIMDEATTEPATSEFLKRETKGKGIVGNIEFIQKNDILAFNYHVRSEGTKTGQPLFENHLCVYRVSNGRRLFTDIIARDLKAQVPDAFFLHKRMLFFVRDQNILTALSLWK
jgi:hypothetical protein